MLEQYTLCERITASPYIRGGKPMVRGERLSVEEVLEMLESGQTPESILKEHPEMEKEDIQACLTYARRLVASERVDTLFLDLAA